MIPSEAATGQGRIWAEDVVLVPRVGCRAETIGEASFSVTDHV